MPAFWGYSVAVRAPDAAGALLEAARLPLVLDLDETLLAAFAGGQLEARLEAARAARRAACADAASAPDFVAQCVLQSLGFLYVCKELRCTLRRLPGWTHACAPLCTRLTGSLEAASRLATVRFFFQQCSLDHLRSCLAVQSAAHSMAALACTWCSMGCEL